MSGPAASGVGALLAPAQLVGYLALGLGIAAFSQRRDQHLRGLIAGQSLAYAVHFVLLGNAAAAVGAAVSSVRSLLSLRYRSVRLAALFVGIAFGLGWWFVQSPLGWLPIIGSSISTVAVFLFRGIPLRLVMLVSTALWLANNVLSGSIGGTMLEVFIASANAFTIGRLILARKKSAAA